MDGDGALPRNTARKSTSSTGRVKTPKRFLSPNLTDNTNPKKRKSLNTSSSNSEISPSSNNVEIKVTEHNSESVKSQNLELKNDNINQTLDVSSTSENSQHSICDLGEIYHDCPTDNKTDHKPNKNNKRVVKNTKYTDFITNKEIDKIFGRDNNVSIEHTKKITRKSAKFRKAKPHTATADLVNENQIQNENLTELNNKSKELVIMPGKSPPSKRRKKVSDHHEPSEKSGNQNLNRSSSTPVSSINVEQLKQTNIVTKKKRKSANSNRNSLPENHSNPELNENVFLINSSSDEQLTSSNSTNALKANSQSSRLNLSIENKRSTRSTSRTSINSEIVKHEIEPAIEMKYDAVVEKLSGAKSHVDNLNIHKIQNRNSKKKSPNIKLIDPNVYDATLLEIKSEEEGMDTTLEPDEIGTTIDLDIENIKIEQFSPYSSNSDLSELFSPIRDCHIHLERLIQSNVPKKLNVFNSFNKIIPVCRCEGETKIQKKSKIIESSSCLASNTTVLNTDTHSTPVYVTPIVPKLNKSARKSQAATTSTIQPKNNKSKKPKIPKIPSMLISNSHVADVIEDVIKSHMTESPEKPDVVNLENKISTDNVVSVSTSKEDDNKSKEDENKSKEDENKSNEDFKSSTITSSRSETESSAELKAVSPKNPLKTSARLKEKQFNKASKESLKPDEKSNIQRTTTTSLLFKMKSPLELKKLKPPETGQVLCLPDGQKIQTPLPHNMEPIPSSIPNINKTPQTVQTVCLPRNLQTVSIQNVNKPENLETTMPESNRNVEPPTNVTNLVESDKKSTDVQKQNIKKFTLKLDEFNISSSESPTINKSDFDLRQVLSEKRAKEKSDCANKYKNLVIQTSQNSNRIILKNPVITFSPTTSKISPNNSSLIQIQPSPSQTPLNDHVKNLFKSNIPNEAACSSEMKTLKSPEIKVSVWGKTLIRSNSETQSQSQLPDIITEKLNKIYSDRQEVNMIEIRKNIFKGSTENIFDENNVETLQVIIDNDISLDQSTITQNESNTEICLENETDINKESTEISSHKPVNDTSQDKCDSFVFAKPKHTFKFIEKCEVKRPPTRKPGKIRLNRPKLDQMQSPAPSTSSSLPLPSPSTSQTVFKVPMQKKIDTKPNLNESLNKYNTDDDVISILADTTGLESVFDVASVKNEDSDNEDDFNVNEVFMDNARFTQVKDWLSQSHSQSQSQPPSIVDEPVTVAEQPVVSPIKKPSDIPVARVNPGIQMSNSEEKSLPMESNSDERVNIKFIPEEKKSARPIEIELFKNICFGKFKHNYCNRKKCYYAHSLPTNWQNSLKGFSVDALMRTYKFVKDNGMVHLYKKLLPLVAEQLGSYKDFNNLTNLVKDVLEINMNTDREPLIKNIIQALQDNGFSFYSTVEIVFRSANVELGLKNLLCDILLNLTVERRQLEDDWPIIQMLSVYKKFDIDKGIIQFIIIEALAKSYLKKDIVFKVYNDLIKRIPDFNMRTISATLCQKFVNLLRKYSLQTDADEMFNRCISLNILEKPCKKIEEHCIISKINPIQQKQQQKQEDTKNKIFEFPPPLITNPQQIDYSKPPPNLLHLHHQYQIKEETQTTFSDQNQNQYETQQVNQPKQEHYSNRPPSLPQQEHHLNQYQPEQTQYQQVQEHLNRTSVNRTSSHHQQEHSNAMQSQEHQSLFIQNQYQGKQEHEMQQLNRSSYQKNPKNHPILPGLRVDKSIIDQQNYMQFYRSTQPPIKSYTTQQQQQPSTSSTSQSTTDVNASSDDFDRFLCYSTENLDLLANTATQNLLDVRREADVKKSYTYNYQATDEIQSPVRVERQPYDDQSYAAIVANATANANANSHSQLALASTVYNFSEVKQLVAEENYVAIMQLIMKHKEGNSTDAFLNQLIGALIETPHNYPTFFSNLSDMSAISNDIGLNYMLKTLGVNLVLHLCQNNQYDPAFRINHVLTTKYKANDFYDVYNCKIYLKNKYSYFRRILIIAQMYIVKGDIPTSWNILRDNAFSCGSYWQSNHDEADLMYRDFVLGKLFESFKKIKNSNIALDALLYLMKYKSTDTNIQEHANSILVNAINNRCNFDKIAEFMNVSSDWYKYLDKNTIRAILVTAYLERKDCVSKLYEIAFNLRICPQLMGNEKIITLNGHYHYAELQLYLDKFFQNMVNFMPITDKIIISFSLNDELSNDEIPLLMHQYNSSKAVLATRVANILENLMKPPIQVLNRNNCLYLDPENVNTHLMYRRQSSL